MSNELMDFLLEVPKPGEYEPSGILGIEHLILLLITTFCVCIALHYTKNKNKAEVKEIIKNVSIGLWVLEIIKIMLMTVNP